MGTCAGILVGYSLSTGTCAGILVGYSLPTGDLRLAYLSALCKYSLSSQMTVVIVYVVVGGGFCCWMLVMVFSLVMVSR